MPLRTLALALGFLPLAAQQAALQAHLDREALRLSPPPAVLVLQEPAGSRALADAFAERLRSEACEAFEVQVRPARKGAQPPDPTLPSGGGWALVGRDGRIVEQGTVAPSAEAFAEALLKAGFRDRGRDLKAYLKQNPDSVDAREDLLELLRQRAERTAQREMGVQVPTRRERLKEEGLAALRPGAPLPKADLSAAKPLDPTADLRAWGAFAQQLDEAFRSGRWRELEGRWLREARPLDTASPTLRLLYQRWQPVVEEALQEAPGSLPFWDLLVWMGAARGGVRLQGLVASLHPEPLTPAGDWPPPQVLRALMETARTVDDWAALRELYRARWESGMSHLQDPDPAGGAPRAVTRGTHAALLEADWTEVLAPLLECSLRSGDAFGADATLMKALEASRWPALPQRAAALARRCGDERLAQRWGALRAPGLGR